MEPPEVKPTDGPSDAAQTGEVPPTAAGDDSKASNLAKKAAARKRTKTGCLTCRKRRIKCDEGKPTCNNCIKSKRQCEGYNQRLTFKEPMGTYPHSGIFTHAAYQHHQAQQQALMNAQIAAARQARSPTAPGQLPFIAPKPMSIDLSNASSYQYGTEFPAQPGSSRDGRFGLSPTQFDPRSQLPLQEYQATELEANPLPHGHSGLETPVSPDRGFGFGNTIPPAPELFANSAATASQQLYTEGVPDFPDPEPDTDDYWYSDDDASMAASDDGTMASAEGSGLNLPKNDSGILVVRRLAGTVDMHSTEVRTFDGFVPGGILNTYVPSSANSPLNDTQTALVFLYFARVTGPSISIFERHPFDPEPMFHGQPVPRHRQHIWTYTFPTLAFQHPALLQAILALASLQMAHLEKRKPTAALKHYHLSLRRNAKNYASASKRTQPATLAASLLLGFYEIWSSDHEKWCKHMWGARAIIREIPLREMTREVLALKRRRLQRLTELRNQQQQAGAGYVHLGDSNDLTLQEVNLHLVSQLHGRSVNYEEFGHIYGDLPAHSGKRYTDRDVENFEHLSDLYWWYCKMDVYQSILGGTRLFMEYERWTQCPPRAPFGRLDAIYGTYDHLMLLLGRLCSFASTDLTRKRLAMRADATRRPPGAGGPPQGQSPTMFPGLLPSTGHFQIPTGFTPPRETSPQKEGADGGADDLETATARAMQEWEAIQQAFEFFRNSLGPDLDPLDPEIAPPHATPFGPSVQYRTSSIAGVWLNYNMGQLVLHRCHPSMPPVAMMAAGRSAAQTAPYAMMIGRISAGLVEDSTVETISTSLGAALIESSFSMFVAGVQLRDTAQRHWFIRRLWDIRRLTGWQSAKQIADGCESAWGKAATFAGGPPYERPGDLADRWPSIWDRPRRLDRKILEMNAGEGRIVLAKSEQAHFALGLLTVEQDLERLDLQAN